MASLVSQRTEDLWKAAGQFAGNVDLIFYSVAEPCKYQQADLYLCPTATVLITLASLWGPTQGLVAACFQVFLP